MSSHLKETRDTAYGLRGEVVTNKRRTLQSSRFRIRTKGKFLIVRKIPVGIVIG